MIESIERMRKLVNDNLVMGLRFQMNGELNKLESEIEQELNSRAERTCRVLEHDELPYAICSECGAIQPDDFTVYYCWACGAKVVGE